MGFFDFFKKKQIEKGNVELDYSEIPYFGTIKLAELEDYYKTEIKIHDRKLNIDLNFSHKSITLENLEILKDFLGSIDKFDKKNKKVIETDFKKSGESSDYINFFLDELDEQEISKIIGLDSPISSKELQLLEKLNLVRVGLYPDGKYGSENYGVFDYSIDISGESCEQVLVVNTNEKGEINNITWES